jgi:hypothetical protein
MLSLLLLTQLTVAAGQIDSLYSTPALREMVSRAAAENRNVPERLLSYRSHIETEMSLLLRDTLGREQTASIEQFATAAAWERGGRYDLHIVGYRAQTVGVPYSTLSIVRAWTVPSLYGERLSLGAYFTNPNRRDTLVAVHPFAADRDSFYHFSGGDTVAVLNVGARRIPIARIRVRPNLNLVSRIGGFDGEIDIDATRFQIVRMRGRFVVAGPPPGKRATLMRALGVIGVAYAEFVNAEVDGKYWLPAFQRTEFQASFPILGQTRPVFRLVSTISDIRVSEGVATVSDTVGIPRVNVTWAPSDSIDAYRDWTHGIGAQTSSVHADDFQDMAPDSWRTDGPPRLALFPPTASRLFRFNRVEGLYTGLAPSIDFRSAVPGLTASGWGGWAWSEQTMRGGASLSYRRAQDTYDVRAERAIVSTNDFTPPFGDDPGFTALISNIDNYDYIDRRSATLSFTRFLGSVDGGVVTVQLGTARDGAEPARLARGLFPGGLKFLANRGATTGTYAHGVADVEVHPNVNGDFVEPGVGLRAHYEIGSGDLDWQRVELSLSARKYVGSISLAAHADGGFLLGANPPPQTLFELGGNEALPGYAYKQFAGDRAALLRTFASYRFHVWERPRHLWRSIYIPGVSPGVAMSAQGGWTELSSQGAVTASHQLVEGTTQIAEPTHGTRATIGGGITLFSGLLHVGLARPVDRPAPWKLAIGFGAQF